MKYILSILLSVISFAASAQEEQETVYSWISDEGYVKEIGGTVAQHNVSFWSMVNEKQGDYYGIWLVGDKDNMENEDDSFEAQYQEITLSDGGMFRSGDEIYITAYRYASESSDANIFFQFDNGANIQDTNEWPDLNPTQSGEFGGGINSGAKRKAGGGTEAYEEEDLFNMPATKSFVVPETADGAVSVKLTRNKNNTSYLYISGISVLRNIMTTVNAIESNVEDTRMFNYLGQRVNGNAKGLVIMNGKKVLVK